MESKRFFFSWLIWMSSLFGRILLEISGGSSKKLCKTLKSKQLKYVHGKICKTSLEPCWSRPMILWSCSGPSGPSNHDDNYRKLGFFTGLSFLGKWGHYLVNHDCGRVRAPSFSCLLWCSLTRTRVSGSRPCQSGCKLLGIWDMGRTSCGD